MAGEPPQSDPSPPDPPQQLTKFASVVAGPNSPRIVLQGPMGGGQPEAIAYAIVKLGETHDREPRVLIVAPSSTHVAWQHAIARYTSSQATIFDAAFYRHLQASMQIDGDPWSSAHIIMCSGEFLSYTDRLENAFGASWDLVVIDAVHGWEGDADLEYVLEYIWASPRAAKVAAICPRVTGWLVWEHLDPKNVVEWNLSGHRPERILEVFSFDPTASETAFRAQFLEIASSLAGTSDQWTWAQQSFQECVGSSVFAAGEFAARCIAINEATAQVREVLAGKGNESSSVDDERPFGGPLVEALIDSLASIPKQSLESVLDSIDDMEVDSKWDKFVNIVEEFGLDQDHAIVYTEFADTAEYVYQRLVERGYPTTQVTSRNIVETGLRIEKETSERPGLLVVTTEAAQSLDLSYADQVVHYDFAINPTNLFVRYQRVEALGNPTERVTHRFIINENTTGPALIQSLERLVREMEAGDRST